MSVSMPLTILLVRPRITPPIMPLSAVPSAPGSASTSNGESFHPPLLPSIGGGAVLRRILGALLFVLLLVLLLSPMASRAEPALDEELESLRDQLLQLNRELFLLEEELLFPANTQVAVFLSMDVGEFFALDSVELRIDDRAVSNYLYTEREVDALHRGGVQQLYLGNLRAGDHELVAVFTGKGPNDRDYRRATQLAFVKGIGARFLELRISDSESRQQPEFVVREWE